MVMSNRRWEIYAKTHRDVGKQRLALYRSEYCPTVDKALETALVEDNMLTALVIEELIKVKKELAKLKKVKIADE